MKHSLCSFGLIYSKGILGAFVALDIPGLIYYCYFLNYKWMQKKLNFKAWGNADSLHSCFLFVGNVSCFFLEVKVFLVRSIWGKESLSKFTYKLLNCIFYSLYFYLDHPNQNLDVSAYYKNPNGKTTLT